MKEKLKRFRPTSGILVTALLILIIGLSLFLLIRSGILVPHSGDREDDSGRAGVQLQLEEPAETGVIYGDVRDSDPKEVLLQLKESDSYVWNFSYIEAWENQYTTERTTVTRAGDKYRIERENLLVICDGDRVYRREGMAESICEADRTSVYLEAGLTSVSFIRANLDGCTVEYNDPVNPKYIRVSSTKDGYRNEYEISLETGFPITERSYIGNMAYRMILTESVTGRSADSFDAKTFWIPQK